MKTLADLKGAPYNPRSLSGEAASGLLRSIDKFGDVSGIVFNERTGNLVSGHQRVKMLAEEYGNLQVKKNRGGSYIETPSGTFPVRVVDWTLEKEKAANVTANNPAISGDWTEGLAEILEELEADLGPEFAQLNLEALKVKQPDLPDDPDDPTRAPVEVSVGEFTFEVEREFFTSWLAKIQKRVGYEATDAVAEFKRLLKL